MADEIELKLVASAKDLLRLSNLSWVRAHAKGPAICQTLISAYYDTEKCTLYERGISLRTRRVGAKRVQTIKSVGSGAPFARKEWEMEISSDRPDLTRMRGTALEPLLNKHFTRQLKPIFETRVRRTTQLIQAANGEVELALDRGQIRCAGDSRRISEVELELKTGTPAVLYDIAQRLSKSVSVSYSAKTKLDRGYALLRGRWAKSLTGDAVVLLKGTDTATALQIIGFSCLRHLTGNEEAVRRRDGEGIHQMRVGLRRFRVAMSVFKDILVDRQSQGLKSELRWLDKQLGPARDYDVFLKEGFRTLERSRLDRREIAALHTCLSDNRAVGFEKARTIVTGERYRRLVLNAALWLADGYWCKDPTFTSLRAQPVKDFGRQILIRFMKKTAKKAKGLERLDDRHRHRLRIAVKKLRYAIEFFDSVFLINRKKCRKYSKTLEKFQSVLGKLNDIQVHRKMIVNAFREGDAGRKGVTSRTQDSLARKEKKASEHLLAAALKVGKHLSTVKPSLG
jgi:triphosphatase